MFMQYAGRAVTSPQVDSQKVDSLNLMQYFDVVQAIISAGSERVDRVPMRGREARDIEACRPW